MPNNNQGQKTGKEKPEPDPHPDNVRRQPMDLASAKVPLGQVYVIPERCKECGFCVEFCPENVLTFSDETNAKGYHYPTVPHERSDNCVHCRFCDLICPELAIFTKEIERPPNGQENSSDGNQR